MEITDWLSAFSSVIIGIATVVLAIVTYHYARVTKHILEESRLMRLEAHKPGIAISLHRYKTRDYQATLRIENIGTGPAHDVQFATDRSVQIRGHTPLEHIGFLKRKIAYFGHGRQLESHPFGVDLNQTPLEITVTYKDSAKRKYDKPFQLDFGELEGINIFMVYNINK